MRLQLIIIDQDLSLPVIEHAVNKAIMLRHFLVAVGPIYELLSSVIAPLLVEIRDA